MRRVGWIYCRKGETGLAADISWNFLPSTAFSSSVFRVHHFPIFSIYDMLSVILTYSNSTSTKYRIPWRCCYVILMPYKSKWSGFSPSSTDNISVASIFFGHEIFSAALQPVLSTLHTYFIFIPPTVCFYTGFTIRKTISEMLTEARSYSALSVNSLNFAQQGLNL